MTLWLKYLLMLPAFIAMTISARMLAPVAVIFFSTADRKQLRAPFRWMMTDDVDLGGDIGWQTEHMPVKDDPYHTLNRIGWMLRNGGHHAAYWVFGCHYLDPHPLFRAKPSGDWWWDVFIGWNMPGPVHGRCKYVFTIRIKRGK